MVGFGLIGLADVSIALSNLTDEHMIRNIECSKLVAAAVLVLIGCSQPAVAPGPSYADLVVTYNAELDALDRLETRREKLAAEFAAAMNPPSDSGALGQLGGLLEAAKELQSEAGGIDPSTVDPNALLDQLTERNEEAGDLAGQLLEGLAGGNKTDGEETDAAAAKQPTEAEAAELAEVRANFEPQLAKLDKEITAQKARVERAKVARDAAEARVLGE